MVEFKEVVSAGVPPAGLSHKWRPAELRPLLHGQRFLLDMRRWHPREEGSGSAVSDGTQLLNTEICE